MGTGILLAGLAAAAFASPALAAIGDRIPFQQFRQQICPDAGICSVNFNVVQPGSRLEVNSVSCSLFVAGAHPAPDVAVLDFVVFNAAGTIVMHDYAVPHLTATTQFGRSFAVNNKTFFFAPPSGVVQVVMVATDVAGLELNCKIAGEREIVGIPQ